MAVIPYPANLSDSMLAALEAANISVSRAPEGLLVNDAKAAQSLIDAHAGSASELEFRKAARLDQLGLIFTGKFASGFSFVGSDSVARMFQIDPASQFNIDVLSNAALGTILASEPWDANSYFIAADNSHMPLSTAQAMRNFGVAVKNYVSQLILTNRVLKDAIGAAKTLAQLNVIDITKGWPANV